MDSEQKENLLMLYCGNGMAKLKKLCYPRICRIGGISQMDYDDLYSIALEALRDSVERYEASKGCSFETFLNGNISRRFSTYVRDRNRIRRIGQAEYDSGGERIFGQTISLEAVMEEGTELTGSMVCGFWDGSGLHGWDGGESEELVEEFLDKLEETQRRIAKLLMTGYGRDEIRQMLGITKARYKEALDGIRQSKYLSMFNGNKREKRKVRANMEDEKTDEIMEIDTTDSYRMDKYSLLSLLNKKSDGEIDCNYVSQRAPFQWQPMQINKFYTRILNNQPIPEIIICEMVENGEKVSYLIDGLQRLSYAEWFRENRIKIGEKGAEFTKIKYRKYKLDKKGNKIFDEKGRAKYEIDTFDVVGKRYRDLPEYLQKRFDDFNVNVTTFFNCTEEMIDYNIRNYNNHVGMSKSQYGITNVSNFTSENIKAISEEHEFFKNYVVCSNVNRRRGALEESVARCVMALDFLEDWKREVLDTMIFVNANADEGNYSKLRGLLDRLCRAGCGSVRELFTMTNSHIWIAVFDRFSGLGAGDTVFISFMQRFSRAMGEFKKNRGTENYRNDFIDSCTYATFMKKNTKDKAIVKEKIDCVYGLLLKFLHMDENNTVRTKWPLSAGLKKSS